MKLSFFQKYQPDTELLALKEALRDAQWELTLAYRQFDLAVDPELVEASVYHINATKARCNYLIRSIKEREQAAEGSTGNAQQTVPARSRLHSKQKAPSPTARTASGTLPAQRAEACRAFHPEGDAVWT